MTFTVEKQYQVHAAHEHHSWAE